MTITQAQVRAVCLAATEWVNACEQFDTVLRQQGMPDQADVLKATSGAFVRTVCEPLLPD